MPAERLVSCRPIDKASKKEKELTNDSVSSQLRKKQYFNRISRDFSYQETDSHDELMEQDGLYAQMFRTQAQWYVG